MRSMRSILALILMLTMVFVLAACGSAPAAPAEAGAPAAEADAPVETVTLNMDLLQAEGSPIHDGALRFAELVKEYTGGRYEIAVFSNCQLGNGNQLTSTEMAEKGTLDIVVTSFNHFSSSNPSFQVLTLPFLIEGNEFVDTKLVYGADVYSKLDEMTQALNLKVLGITELGWRDISNSKHTISSPADMEGLKFRAADAITIASMTAMGANPTNIDFGELFTALQQGAADGQENPVAGIFVPNRFYEVQKYLTIWEWVYTGLPICMNLDLWNSLSADDQAAIQQAATEACEYQKGVSRDFYGDAIQICKDNGVEITELTPEQKAAFKVCVEPLYAEYLAKADADFVKMITG